MKDTEYMIDGFMKTAEKDKYNEGCLPDTMFSVDVDITLKSGTTDGLKKKIMEFFDVDEDATTINSCDEDGRIDIVFMENGDGMRPTKSELESWKKGEIPLWYCTYSGFLEKVERMRW